MILEGIASILGGGITGLAGSAINLYGQNKKYRNDLQKIKIQGDQDLKTMALEFQHADSLASRVQDTEIIKNDTDLLKTAIESDKASYSKGVAGALVKLGEGNKFASIMGVAALSGLAFVDIIRGMLRPVICAYLTYAVVVAEGEIAIQAQIYMAGSAVGFYFGSRTLGKVFKGGSK